jgi:signal transduction histidine kinase
VANASHELRTPLAVMLADLDWALKKERTVGDYKNTIANTRQEVGEMSTLIRSLLMLTRLNDQKLQFIPVDLSRIISQAVAEHQTLAKAKDINIQTKVANLYTPGNTDLLAVACSNLLENAAKYAPQGSTINITEEAVDDMVRVRVSNRTDELSQNDLPYLFDRFYQAEAHQASQGSGLGLAIVKQIVGAHGGSIEATLSDRVITLSFMLPKIPKPPLPDSN